MPSAQIHSKAPHGQRLPPRDDGLAAGPSQAPRVSRGQRVTRRALALAFLAVLSGVSSGCALAAASDELPAVAPVTRPGDGRPVAGLGKDFHRSRRDALRRELGDEGLVILRGLPESRGYTEFRQDKSFWYLTGVASPNATLVMDLGSGEELLFLPEPNAQKEGWEGELWDSGDAWVKEVTGFEEVRPAGELMSTLRSRLPSRGTAWVPRAPHVTMSGCFDRAGPADRAQAQDPLDGRPSREDALAGQLAETFGAQVKDLSPTLGELRRVKSADELAALRRAADSGARAMIKAIESTAPGVGEWEIDALLGFEQLLHGADGVAYYAIVGSGSNSCVLHYNASSRRMQDGELLLVDAGPELDHYTTDITRTWPVNGRFTPEQAAMYDAVLAAQEKAIAAVKPGVTLAWLSDLANGELRARGYGDQIRHGVCHYVGLEVHDTGSYAKPLEPGVVFTIEPGAYDEAKGYGVRIEDVVVVTETGCEVITRGVPVDRTAVEELVGRRAGSLAR